MPARSGRPSNATPGAAMAAHSGAGLRLGAGPALGWNPLVQMSRRQRIRVQGAEGPAAGDAPTVGNHVRHDPMSRRHSIAATAHGSAGSKLFGSESLTRAHIGPARARRESRGSESPGPVRASAATRCHAGAMTTPDEPTPRPSRQGRSGLRRNLAIAMILAGLVWIGQGLGILTAGRSFMIGDPTWAVIGAALALAGAVLLLRMKR